MDLMEREKCSMLCGVLFLGGCSDRENLLSHYLFGLHASHISRYMYCYYFEKLVGDCVLVCFLSLGAFPNNSSPATKIKIKRKTLTFIGV